MESNGVALVTALCGGVLGYCLNIYKVKLNHSLATEVNERDLLKRIDNLQQQMIEMAKENASLKLEVKSLRNEIRQLRKHNDALSHHFNGDDYSAGAPD